MRRWPSPALIALLALLLGATGDARAAEGALGRAWAGLWRTPDQRGQAALDAGDPTTAAQLFRDPRRKAYAELKAGRYQEAAKGFAAFDDAAAQYDRGNALARAGELQQALQAFDAALAKDPSDRDARHNRDLVAQALAQQPPKLPGKPGSSGGSDKSGQAGKSANPSDAGKTGGAGPAGAPGSAAPAPSAGDQAASSPSSGASSAAAGQGHLASAAAAGAASQASAGAASAPDAPAARYGAAQARREAAAARAAASAAGAQRAADALGAASAPAGHDAPTTEQQLAEDQWLRGIPDDPAGLLRRKFLIQHLLRQQGGPR